MSTSIVMKSKEEKYSRLREKIEAYQENEEGGVGGGGQEKKNESLTTP